MSSFSPQWAGRTISLMYGMLGTTRSHWREPSWTSSKCLGTATRGLHHHSPQMVPNYSWELKQGS